MDLDVGPEQLGDDQRVAGGGGHRSVAAHRRDADHVGMHGGQEDGERVVVAGIAVEEHLWSGHGVQGRTHRS